MEVEDELEALKATFTSELQWNTMEPTAVGGNGGYRLDFSHGSQTIMTLELNGESYLCPVTEPEGFIVCHWL